MKIEQSTFLQNWIQNNNDNMKKKILILGYSDKSFDFRKHIYENFPDIKETIFIEKLTKFNEKTYQDNKNKNIIVYTNSNINFDWFDNFKIYDDLVFYFIQFYTEEEQYKYKSSSSIINFYFEKIEPIIILNNINKVEYFINVFIEPNSDFLLKFNNYSINEYFFRNKDKIDLYRIKTDIEYLKSTFILTSRLAIFIYKFSKFEPYTNEKKIGEYFAKYFGKSKIFNNKKFSISNTKGYKIESYSYQTNNNLREEIAFKLLDCNVPTETILFATNIDVTKIQNQ